MMIKEETNDIISKEVYWEYQNIPTLSRNKEKGDTKIDRLDGITLRMWINHDINPTRYKPCINHYNNKLKELDIRN